MVARALFGAVSQHRPCRGLILHSDRGSQYCAKDYQRLIRQFGMQYSMSRRGNCYDNAPMESFWSTLKIELVHHRRYTARAQARRNFHKFEVRGNDHAQRHFISTDRR